MCGHVSLTNYVYIGDSHETWIHILMSCDWLLYNPDIVVIHLRALDAFGVSIIHRESLQNYIYTEKKPPKMKHHRDLLLNIIESGVAGVKGDGALKAQIRIIL